MNLSKEEVNQLDEAYKKSLDALKKSSNKHGFQAASVSKDRYDRVWGRDSMICLIAALASNDKNLIAIGKKSLLTLMRFQHKHGQIPSNVDVEGKNVSYGGTTGRIDATLWFLVGFGEYVKSTRDFGFLRKHYKRFKRAIELVHLYEFNDRGFIYVPKGGDWADEYIQEGYVLYDQLLYYKAIEEFIYVRKKLKKRTNKLQNKLKKLRVQLRYNYLLEKDKKDSKFIYHKFLFNRCVKLKKYKKDYMLPYFNPSEYGFRFDGFANALALLFGILTKEEERKVSSFVFERFSEKTNYLVSAFDPVITKSDSEWKELEGNFSNSFKNEPYEYHNGGLWPMITGFYAAYFTMSNKNFALKYLKGINYSNSLPVKNDKKSWKFFEYLNGKNFEPGGMEGQAWSAAAGVMAYQSLVNGRKLFR